METQNTEARITAATRKLVTSLRTAHGRRENSLFVAEGQRCVFEILPFFHCRWIIATDAWLQTNIKMLPPGVKVLKARPDEMERMSSMQTPQGILAVFEIPEGHGGNGKTPAPRPGSLILALDHLQDPGNLGTIIRVADWFGIRQIWASSDTVDIYNPKVVQSTMGGLARVNIHYCDLPETLAEATKNGIPVYGTFLDGEDIYTTPLSPAGIIVMGNEGNGISPAVEPLCNRRIKIPSFPAGATKVESLNVSTATAITVAEFRRRTAQ